MSTRSPKPATPFPDTIIIAILTGDPGAVAIMSADGYPLAIRPLPDIERGELFASDGLLAQVLLHNADVGTIAKVVIAPDGLARTEAPADEVLIHGGVGYLYRLLIWLKIPTILADPGWLSQYSDLYEGRSALWIVKEKFPDFFEEAHASESLARAALLGFIAVTNPDWPGVDLALHATATPASAPPAGHTRLH